MIVANLRVTHSDYFYRYRFCKVRATLQQLFTGFYRNKFYQPATEMAQNVASQNCAYVIVISQFILVNKNATLKQFHGIINEFTLRTL